MDERRRHPRVALNMVVQFRHDSMDAFISEHATNISMGGMFIETEAPKSVGDVVYLQFTLSDTGQKIEGMGKVIHVNPPGSERTGMGIEFVNLDAEFEKVIDQIVSERTTP